MTVNASTTLRELAFIVCTALDRAGETAVLTGGSAATVYAPEAYQSKDLDFVFTMWSAVTNPSEMPLIALGFTRVASSYHHPLTPLTLEFPPGPLAVGEEQITSWTTLLNGDLILHILSPTDCVRDRLAWFLFDNDFSALEQALAVARTQDVEIEVIRRWCVAEGEAAKFVLFEARLDARNTHSQIPTD